MQGMAPETFDMIYLDPPFYTQKTQTLSDKEGNKYSFSDTWNTISDYKAFMSYRIKEALRLLKSTGSIFLHCDSSASHHLRLLLDDIFGQDNFRSEIVWTYKRWTNSKKGLTNNHQTIFFYSKSDAFKFNKVYTEYSVTTNLDQILQDRVRGGNGKAKYKTDDNGDIVFSSEKKGVPLSDVWNIPFLNPKAKERVGYPTQKPILLLERIIEISTDPGDIVLDPFCGSGTTLVAAKINNRKYVGIDSSDEAVKLSKQRLDNPYKSESQLLKLGKKAYDTKSEYEKAILSTLDCDIVQRNKGIDAFLKGKFSDGLVAIRIQKPEENLADCINLLAKAGEKKKCAYLILIQTVADTKSFVRSTKKPDNMMVIHSYDLIISKYISSQYNNVKQISL